MKTASDDNQSLITSSNLTELLQVEKVNQFVNGVKG